MRDLTISDLLELRIGTQLEVQCTRAGRSITLAGRLWSLNEHGITLAVGDRTQFIAFSSIQEAKSLLQVSQQTAVNQAERDQHATSKDVTIVSSKIVGRILDFDPILGAGHIKVIYGGEVLEFRLSDVVDQVLRQELTQGTQNAKVVAIKDAALPMPKALDIRLLPKAEPSKESIKRNEESIKRKQAMTSFSELEKQLDLLKGETQQIIASVLESAPAVETPTVSCTDIEATIPCSKFDTFVELYTALKELKDYSRSFRFQPTSCSKQADFYVFRIPDSQWKRLREIDEGWTVAGPWNSSRVVSWQGRVVDVDIDTGLLTVKLALSANSPKESEAVYAYSPDYKAAIRDWVLRKRDSNAKLPAPYLQLCRGDLEKLPACFSAADYLRLDPTLRAEQRQAVENTGRPLSLVWGPPGTGKTYTLGAIVAALTLHGKRALILAPTNNAVDGAVLKIDEARRRIGRPIQPGELVRAGRPSLEELSEKKDLLAWNHELEACAQRLRKLGRLLHELMQLRPLLQGSEREALNGKIAETKLLIDQQQDIRKKLLWDVVSRANVVATTICSALCNDDLMERLASQFDALIIDESSMVPRYVMVRLLYRPIPIVCLFGDFQQLNPVCEGDSEKLTENCSHWFSDSIFDAATLRGEDDAARMERNGCLTMLTEQNRMHVQLCQPLSEQFYLGRLVTVGEHQDPPYLLNWPQSNLAIVDLDNINIDKLVPVYKQVIDPDKFKVGAKYFCWRSAVIAVHLVQGYLESFTDRTAIMVTPYKDQGDLLKEFGRQFLQHNSRWIAGTVHRIQGQEANLVIFTPCFPSSKRNRGIGHTGRDIRKLYCVTFSRAKQQILIVGRKSLIMHNPILSPLCKHASTWKPDFNPASLNTGS